MLFQEKSGNPVWDTKNSSAKFCRKKLWKILYYFIMFCIPFYFSRQFLCSLYFPANFLFLHKIVDISVLTRIGLAPPVPSGIAHLFGINAGVLFGVELVLI
jgi:hypothetical protein